MLVQAWGSHCCLFFFNDTATTEIYTLSLHDALPISHFTYHGFRYVEVAGYPGRPPRDAITGLVFHSSLPNTDRKSTRLNSSHANISYAVFCLKKKKKKGRLGAGTASPQNTPSPGKRQ